MKKQKKLQFSKLWIFLGLILIMTIASLTYFYTKPIQMKQSSLSRGASIPSDWKTYSIPNKLSFQYPPNYIVRSAFNNEVISISASEEDFTPASFFITIDARLDAIYSDYEKSITAMAPLSQHSKKEELTNGLRVTTDLSDIFEPGSYSSLTYYKFKNGAITARFNDNGTRKYNEIVDTILINEDSN